MLCLLFTLNLNHKSLNQFDRERKNLLFFIFGHNALFCVIFCVKINLIFRQASCLHPLWKLLWVNFLRSAFQNLVGRFAKVRYKQKLLFIKMVQLCDRFQCFKCVSFIHHNIISSFFITPNDISLSLSSSLLQPP